MLLVYYRSPTRIVKGNVDENIPGGIEESNPYVSFIVGDLKVENTNWWGNINDYPG